MATHRKTSSRPGGADDIRRQAELLSIGRHAGVVELVGVEGSPDRPVLVTILVEGPPLTAPRDLTVEEVAGLVRELATTLADLHDLGIVHGAVTPEHVLLAPDGRPVLCGFGSAGRVGGAAPGDGDELDPAADVAALGRLLRRLATGPDARPLRRVAEAATAKDPAARPSARDLVAELAIAVPGARLPGPPAKTPHDGLPGHDRVPDLRSLVAVVRNERPRIAVPHRPPKVPSSEHALNFRPAASDRGGGHTPGRPSGRATTRQRGLPIRPLVGGIGAVATVGLLATAPWSPTGTDAPPVRPPAVAAAQSPTPRPTTTSAPTPTTLATVRAGCPAPTSVVVADVDGDGCLDALRYADGILEAAGEGWELGRPGDQVATGDWSCRGQRTVALLRPSTGEVFRFDAWASGAAHSVTGSLVATVPGGQAVRAADVDRDGCHELVVERGELPPQVVRLTRPKP